MGGTGVCFCAVQITKILWRANRGTIGRLAPSCKGAKLMDGKVFKGSVGHQELAAWVEGLGL